MDHDIVQGAEDQGIQEEEGGGETSQMMNMLIRLLGNMYYPLGVVCTSEYTQRTSVYRASFFVTAVTFSIILPNSARRWPRQLKIIYFLSNVFPIT